MSNYKIIADKEKLLEFIEWLPELRDYEKYYVSLWARKKFCKELRSTSSDRLQLRRFLATKENLVYKLEQLEIPLGRYKLREVVAPQESLAVYISPNPRCMVKAQKDMLIKLANGIASGNYYYNVHQEAMSCAQAAKAKSYFVDFDIDDKNVNLSKLDEIVPKAYDILETRGGYHILVHPDKAPKTNWYKQIKNAFDVDIVGDNLVPIPGCNQGMFIPTLTKHT